MSQESLQKQTVISREVMKCLFVLLPAGVLLSSLRLRVTERGDICCFASSSRQLRQSHATQQRRDTGLCQRKKKTL